MKPIENVKIEPAPDTRRKLDGFDEEAECDELIVGVLFRVLLGFGILFAGLILFGLCAAFAAIVK